MKLRLAIAAPLALLAACAHSPDGRVRALEQQLEARDAEIASLRRQLNLTADQPVAGPAQTPAVPWIRPGSPAEQADATTATDSEARALEEALVQRGAQLLPSGEVQLEPEISYTYWDVDGARRDTVRTALTARVGLPWSAQAEIRVPVVVYDHASGGLRSSGLGDIGLGLSKELLAEQHGLPSVVLAGRYWTDTGRSNRALPTGLGADAFQGQLTLAKSDDPIVLFGGLGYTIVGEGELVDYGDILSGHFGAYLAATPGTSLFAVVGASSNRADRIDGIRIPGSSQVNRSIELGATRILFRRTFLNLSGSAGFGRGAPDFTLVVSLPTRF